MWTLVVVLKNLRLQWTRTKENDRDHLCMERFIISYIINYTLCISFGKMAASRRK